VLVRFDHVARHHHKRESQPAERQRIGNQIDAALIFAQVAFRKRSSTLVETSYLRTQAQSMRRAFL
jgi:hypothetical protein